MSEFIIDAPLLACPNPDNFTREDFQDAFVAFLSRLSDFTMLRSSCKSVRFWRDEELASILHTHNCYPFRHSLANAFNQLFDSLEFQLEDINILATSLLERSLVLEEEGEIKDIVVGNCSLVDDPVPERGDPFVLHLCRALALAIPILGDGKVFSPSTYLASYQAGTAADHLEARCEIDMVELADGTYSTDMEPVSAQVTIYRNIDSLSKEVTLTTWWSKASADALIDAIGVQASIDAQAPWTVITKIRDLVSIGTDFISSAKALGFMHDPTKISRILRVCTDLALNRNLGDSHWLRAGKGANEPQRTRGDWVAWRHDIDYEFHLHYWRQGNRIEFANIVVHNDFDITR